MDQLPPSLEVLAEEAAAGEVLPLEDRPISLLDLRRGRGLLVLFSLLGVGFFLLPWVEIRSPDVTSLRGLDLALRAGWFWGGAIGWFVLLPLVVTRRTIRQMRGVRIIACLFAGLTLAEILMLVALPPAGSKHVSVEYFWGVGLYLSAMTSLLGTVVATRFGGATKLESSQLPSSSDRTPDGATLH